MPAKYPHVVKAEKYARDVIDGKIPSCKYVRTACQRHFDDKKKSRNKAYLYKFDREKAERVCEFAELLPHIKGKWQGKNIELQPWQCFILCVIFGWIIKSSGLRRFRRADIMIPRKNGKSTIAAIIGLYMLVADNEQGAEVYCGAVSQDQAFEVFRPAQRMATRAAGFVRDMGVAVHARSITQLHSGSSFKPLIGKPGDGSSPSCAITDEYHEHADDSQVNTMRTGMGAREQPLHLIITTAGENVGGPCYLEFDDAKKILDRTKEDDRLFVIIYTIDDDDSWDDVIALYKANPNIGVSVKEDDLIAEQKDAISTPRKQAIFKTKHLNLWVGAMAAYYDVEKYRARADKALKIEDFKGCPVRLALDIATKIDLNVLDYMFEPEPGRYVSFTDYFLPEDTIFAPGNDHYKTWNAEGWIIGTDGEVIDFEYIKNRIDIAMRDFEVIELAFDPWQAAQFSNELMAAGVPIIEFRQTLQNFSEPTKLLDALIRSGRYTHDGNPVSTWCVGNVIVYTDPNDNVRPKKARKENMIDGAIAKIMNLGRVVSDEGQTESVYESRGIRTL